jgi:hypothetical protein
MALNKAPYFYPKTYRLIPASLYIFNLRKDLIPVEVGLLSKLLFLRKFTFCLKVFGGINSNS